jgi:hypothetical protein
LFNKSLSVNSSGIKWYWLELGLFASSQNGLRPLNAFFNCLKHRRNHKTAFVLGNSTLYFPFGVRNFVLRDSEINCCCVSYGYASVLLAPPSQSRSALFGRVDLANRTLVACYRWIRPSIVHVVPAYYHVGSCLSYHPVNYSEVAGSSHGFRISAWGSCNRPGLPKRLISPAGLLHLESS